MKRRLLMLLSVFMTITSVGWLQAADIVWTVDATRTEADTQTAFKTLKAAVQAANNLGGIDKLVITVAPGNYDIERTNATTGDGNYLAITRDNVEIVGGGQEPSDVKIYSSAEAVNGNWVDQNLITIHGDNVKIQNATITCKKQVNKVIEVLGDHVTLNNLVFNAPVEEKFAGSIYFNSPAKDTEKNIGTVTLKNLVLNNGRITFTGAEKGTVNMEGIQLYYNDVTITGESMSDLQQYTPFGAIANKPNLALNGGESVNVYLKCSENSYKLDAATVANMPAGSSLNLVNEGEYALTSQLVINKPLSLKGELDKDGNPATTITAIGEWNVDDSKKNLISIEGNAGGTVKLQNLCIKGSKGSGINAQSQMSTILPNVTLENNTNAGLLVHSEVHATNLHTKGNTWGGVNVDKGNPEYPRLFTFDERSTFAESAKIWVEKENASNPDGLVVCPEGQSWSYFEGLGGKDNKTPMYYWTNSKLTQEGNTVFANGNPITIKAAGVEGEVIVCATDNASDFIQLKSDEAIVYGGSKNRAVENSTITMESGNIKRIYGGGYGSTAEKTANVTGTATIMIKGGTIMDLLCGGGDQFAKTNAVDINISGNQTKVQCLYAGGFANPAQKTPVTTWNDAVCGTKDVKITISEGVELPEGLGCGGGQGYAYTGTSKVTITGAKLGSLYGTLSNGYADEIEASLKNCMFSKEGNYYEMGAINRGQIRKGSFMFEGCTFNNLTDLKASLGAVDGWADSDTNGKPVPTVSEGVTFKFVDSKSENPIMMIGQGLANANIELTGTKASLKKFRDGTAVSEGTSDFAIAAGKTWSFNSGLELGTGEEAATLVNNGKLNLPVSDIMTGINLCGGTLMVNAATVVADSVIVAMNKATNKSDLSEKTFSIECKDGVIASNKTVAKELLNAGKVVYELTFNSDQYTIASFQKTLAKITNLPDSVVYGTAPIKLAFNLPGTEVSIDGTSEVVALSDDGVLTIKKPGTVTFDLKVKKDKNNDGVIDEQDKENGNFTYDEDAVNTQVLKVNKRKVTLTAGLTATEKTYDGAKTITLTKGTLGFSGKLGTDATGLDLAEGFKGELTDANAGENKEVIVTAALAANGSDSTAFYELAPITFVKAKVTPKAATVTAEAKSREYGVENPEFTATTTDLVEGDKLDGILKFTCSATKDSLVKEGGYDIVPYGLTSDNYTITFAKGTLTINAVAPVIEMVEAKTVLNGTDRDIQLKARLVNKGGVDTDASVKFTYNSGNSVDATLKDDFYTATISNAAAGKYSITASATVSDNNTGTSKPVEVTIDEKTPQVVSFSTSVLPTMVYGNEMTLSATSDKEAATGEYTYTVAESDLATITDGKLEATKVGKVTLTVTRAADATHSAAVATKTIEITPKPITVAVGAIEKVYDGTTAIETLPTFTLTGASNDVSVKTADLTLSFASKNAGESVKVLMPELTLTGTNAANYTLIQPTNVTGKITKAPLSVKVKDVTRMWNQRYTKYEFEATGLVNDETLSTAYSGELTVTEEGSALNLKMSGACPNYTITTFPGTLTVELGTPKAVVYGTSSDRKAMIVDEAGYSGLKASEVGGDGYANILDASGKVIGQSLNKIETSPATTTSLNAPMQTKAAVAGNWNEEAFKEIPYGASYEVTKLDGTWTYESTNANVLTVDATADNIVCTPVATGKATILAINSSTGEVQILNFEVTPKELKYVATMDKSYDGTTLASGTIELKDGDNVVSGIDVALDISGITFNFNSKNAGANKITPSQAPILIGSEANNYTLASGLTGTISQKTLKVETPLSAYYNGKSVMELTDYASNDRISGDIVPIKVTFGAATVGEQTVELAMGTTGDAGNYKLASSQPGKGNILKSTIVAVLPEGASSASNLKSKIKLTVRETGEAVIGSEIDFNPTITSEGSGSNAVYYVNGGETENYSVVYDKNQIGFKSESNPPAGGGDEEETVTITLDATTKDLPRTEEFVLTATVSPAGKTVTWSSSDPTVASVTADGNKVTVKGVKVGKATITATIGDVTATCEVTVGFATGLEEALANTEVFGRKGNIYVNPIQPLQVTVVNMIGKIVYNARISGNTQIPVTKGIYIVKLTNAGNSIVTKVNVY